MRFILSSDERIIVKESDLIIEITLSGMRKTLNSHLYRKKKYSCIFRPKCFVKVLCISLFNEYKSCVNQIT